MFGMGWMGDFTPEPSPFVPEPKKVSESRLSVPTGADFQRRPCAGRGSGCDGENCKQCGGRMVGWAPDRDFAITCEARPARPHPLEGRHRRDEDGKWFLAPLAEGLRPSGIAPDNEKRRTIEFGPHTYFGGP